MTALTWTAARGRLQAYLELTKPRVVALMLLTALVGMLLATPELPESARMLAAAIGIALVAGGAAACNCLREWRLDARMARTRGRALPQGRLRPGEAAVFAGVLIATGLLVLGVWVNLLTAALTAATFYAYAVIYTRWLKPRTPQNIVIGGAAGAMPPVLGWAAMTGEVAPEAWLLALIIYTWTPPHFWALALTRSEDYRRAGLPMLPVTHGGHYTRQSIWLHSLWLAAASLMPVAAGLAGPLYLAAAVVLDARFLQLTWRLRRSDQPALAQQTFAWSIHYLALLFAALLVDHYAPDLD
ncbi:MAG: heme o synthase [Thiobacillaceae bacterium]|nr:heme o synthase [Thiobacillaceae bacterium]